eukprot:6586471-Karenia_brevis.AAC.1
MKSARAEAARASRAAARVAQQQETDAAEEAEREAAFAKLQANVEENGVEEAQAAASNDADDDDDSDIDRLLAYPDPPFVRDHPSLASELWSAAFE